VGAFFSARGQLLPNVDGPGLQVPLAQGASDGAVTQLRSIALWLGYLMVPPNPADLAVVKDEIAARMQQLPDWLQSPEGKYLPSLSAAHRQPQPRSNEQLRDRHPGSVT